MGTFHCWHHIVYCDISKSSDYKSLICDANEMRFYDKLRMQCAFLILFGLHLFDRCLFVPLRVVSSRYLERSLPYTVASFVEF